MIFFCFSKKIGFWVFLVHPTVVSVLLSASVERCFVSRMRDLFNLLHGLYLLSYWNFYQGSFMPICLLCLISGGNYLSWSDYLPGCSRLLFCVPCSASPPVAAGPIPWTEISYCTLYNAHCTLHIAYCTLHTANSTLYTAHYILRTEHFSLRTYCYTLHSEYKTLYIQYKVKSLLTNDWIMNTYNLITCSTQFLMSVCIASFLSSGVKSSLQNWNIFQVKIQDNKVDGLIGRLMHDVHKLT